jgi:tetratricopeptide (TPR) repeat protein
MEEHLAHLTADKNYKSIAYENLAEAYFHAGKYDNAIKAYKKLLMLSWQKNDGTSEMRAFNGMAIQYFYSGEIDKC